jgi:putative flippase GtrA
MTGFAEIGHQFAKFSAVGVIAAVGHYGTLLVAVEIGGARPLPASLAAFLVGAAISYVLNYHFTFASRKSHPEALSKFLSVAAVGFVLNGVVMAVLTGPVPIHYILAQLVATGVVLVWTFSSNRLWTFDERGRS